MIDYYKILNVRYGASEFEIKKQFRKLATTNHPDKNGGSEKSEETFKEILNAYEILSNKESRAIYDEKYKKHFKQLKTETTIHNNTSNNIKYDQPKQPTNRNIKYQKTSKTNLMRNYIFWILVLIIALIYLYNTYKQTIINPKTGQQMEDQQYENRPQSGEIDFNN